MKTTKSPNQLWRDAQASSRYIEENEAAHRAAQSFVQENNIVATALACGLLFLFDIIILGVPTIKLITFIESDGPLWHVSILAMVIALAFIIKGLLAAVHKNGRANSKHEKYIQKIREASLSSVAHHYIKDALMAKRERRNGLLALCCLIGIIVFLAIGRTYSLVDNFTFTDDWAILAGSFVLSTLLFLSYYATYSTYVVYQDAHKRSKAYHKHTKRRSEALNQYQVRAEQLINQRLTATGIVDDYTTDEQRIIENYQAINRGGLNYDYLKPTHSILLEVYFDNEPANGLQVVSMTEDGSPTPNRTNARGRITIKWKSYEPTLKMLWVGNRAIPNLKASDEIQRIELTGAISNTLIPQP